MMEDAILDFTKLNILVVGDAILDEYCYGKVDRISPEAPIPILTHTKSIFKLGGAANVAQNLSALKANVTFLAVIGNDQNGERLKRMCNHAKMDCRIFTDITRQTTHKKRYINKGKHLLRIDNEDCFDLNETLKQTILDEFNKILTQKTIHLIVLQDYDKGVFAADIVQKMISKAHASKIKVSVDPKVRNFKHYKNADLIKPNLAEISTAYGKELQLDTLKKGITELNKELNIAHWYVTLSDKGIFYYGNEEYIIHQKTAPIEIIDVCGAGDSVMSIIALLFASNYHPETITKIANTVGALACFEQGTAVINLELLESRLK